MFEMDSPKHYIFEVAPVQVQFVTPKLDMFNLIGQ